MNTDKIVSNSFRSAQTLPSRLDYPIMSHAHPILQAPLLVHAKSANDVQSSRHNAGAMFMEYQAVLLGYAEIFRLPLISATPYMYSAFSLESKYHNRVTSCT